MSSCSPRKRNHATSPQIDRSSAHRSISTFSSRPRPCVCPGEMEEEERIDGIISERGEIAEPPQFPAPVMRNVEYKTE